MHRSAASENLCSKNICWRSNSNSPPRRLWNAMIPWFLVCGDPLWISVRTKGSLPTLRLWQYVQDLKRTLQVHLPQLLLRNATSDAEVQMASLQQSSLNYRNYSSLHNTLGQCFLTFSVSFSPYHRFLHSHSPLLWMNGRCDNNYVECFLLNHGVCPTLSTACFRSCSKLAVVFKYALITDSTSMNVF